MSESSTVIKHYKKQLIFRQHDICPDSNYVKKEDETKKIRRKRKNKNCRGQFRHEAMELIKLGTSKFFFPFWGKKMSNNIARVVYGSESTVSDMKKYFAQISRKITKFSTNLISLKFTLE